ncbi:MAG TPA: phosphopantothenoylcysteine decarboxylase [Verrucomicrobiae bacterium]|nr:phosphopantothenoylcysteine decarboxylase [Verrucomicrobiae bacterium]
MNCIVTAGPTYESLDDVRRLTNFSTGRLGSEFASFLSERGHSVTLLLGEQASYRDPNQAAEIQAFTSTEDLREKLQKLALGDTQALFHAAAVSDYKFGRIWVRAKSGDMVEVKSGKISTRDGPLLAELVPTPKIISELREWFPKARIIGWKYEVEGDRTDAISLSARQITECRTDRAVANGPAYGDGFGLVAGDGSHVHLRDRLALFNALEKFIR